MLAPPSQTAPGWHARKRGQWRELATRLVDGFVPVTGRYEQFAGYFALEPLLIRDVAVPPVAADLLLGRDRVARSQLIKQPDVLMLHHLVPDQVEPGSLEPNLDYYDPRTAHGSSLSPAITASLLARAGRPDEALTMLRVALALDLDDLTGMTGAGLHMANLGGIWQAVVAGMAGVRVRAGVMTVDPRLPGAWGGLQVRFRCLGRKVRLDITHDRTEIWADGPLMAARPGQAPSLVTNSASFRRRGEEVGMTAMKTAGPAEVLAVLEHRDAVTSVEERPRSIARLVGGEVRQVRLSADLSPQQAARQVVRALREPGTLPAYWRATGVAAAVAARGAAVAEAGRARTRGDPRPAVPDPAGAAAAGRDSPISRGRRRDRRAVRPRRRRTGGAARL